MAEGVGVDVGAFASPVWPAAGIEDEEETRGILAYDDEFASQELAYMGDLPAFADIGPDQTEDLEQARTRSLQMARGQPPVRHWSQLLDYRHGPLFWLLVAFLLYEVLVSVQLHARVSGGVG